MARPFPHVEGVTHRFVEARGLRFHVAEAGPPDGDAVLMIHGWPQHWYVWRRQIPVLADAGYRVIAPDLRGFGWSEAPPDGYDKENMATDVLAVMDALGLDRVRLMGHDWGGWIGFLLCVRAPERFIKYVPLNITHLWGSSGSARLRGLSRFWYQVLLAAPLGGHVLRNRPGFVRMVIQGSSPHPQAWTDAELEEFVEVLREPARAAATMALYRTFVREEFLPVARGRYHERRLTVPTRMLFGVEDRAISVSLLDRDPDEFADDMKIEFVPDTGHFIAEERAELVNDRALEFFADTA